MNLTKAVSHMGPNIKYQKQRGNFTVEFAIVAVFFSLLIVFSGDIVIKMAVKGKLDRMSYSAATVIKERTELFDENSFLVTQAEFNEADTIIKASLKRTMSGFEEARYGSVLEVQTFNSISTPAALATFRGGSIRCAIGTPLDPALSVITTWNRMATLYRVTLCYETDNWFGKLIGEDFKMVVSNSVTIGR